MNCDLDSLECEKGSMKVNYRVKSKTSEIIIWWILMTARKIMAIIYFE